MIRLTHSSCSTLSGSCPPTMAPTKAVTRATKLTVSWNWRNLRMLLNTERPHSTLLTMDEKLSSRMMMSAASLATSVPAMPMARPTSLSLRAGASLVPSPVTATTSPCCFSMLTRVSLSSGEERARTLSLGSWATSSSLSMFLNVGPSMAMKSVLGGRMPHSRAMWRAVWMLSPVTMRTVMPALWQVATASGTSGRTGSLIPTMASAVNSSSTWSEVSKKSAGRLGSSRGSSRTVRQMQRRPRDAISVTMLSSSSRLASVMARRSPDGVNSEVHLASTHSAAPLLYTLYTLPALTTQLLIFLAEENPNIAVRLPCSSSRTVL
mmetsp:Transcript_27870/g.61129  ORF Transcript_27870/g.61129 Transcript_27870/m.61129 type:complete len:322 (-) Transcript_27870:1572-2537(-)